MLYMRGLSSLANGAGLFHTLYVCIYVYVRRSARLRMSQDGSTIQYTRAPTTLFLRDSWVQIPPPALSISIYLFQIQNEEKE